MNITQGMIRACGQNYFHFLSESRRLRNPTSAKEFKSTAYRCCHQLRQYIRELDAEAELLDKRLAWWAERIDTEQWTTRQGHEYERFTGLVAKHERCLSLIDEANAYFNGHDSTTPPDGQEYIAIQRHNGKWWCQRRIKDSNLPANDGDLQASKAKPFDAKSVIDLVKALRAAMKWQAIWQSTETGWVKVG